jgi:hypothetical protein
MVGCRMKSGLAIMDFQETPSRIGLISYRPQRLLRPMLDARSRNSAA